MPPDDRKARLEAAAHAHLDVRDAENTLAAAKQALTRAERDLPATAVMESRPAAVNILRGQGAQAHGVVVVISGRRTSAAYDYTVGTPA